MIILHHEFSLDFASSTQPTYKSTENNWGKFDAFHVRVMGLIQSALIPKTGEIFCVSLDDIVIAMDRGKEREISPKAV